MWITIFLKPNSVCSKRFARDLMKKMTMKTAVLAPKSPLSQGAANLPKNKTPT
jgi:hypothetical protein